MTAPENRTVLKKLDKVKAPIPNTVQRVLRNTIRKNIEVKANEQY